METVRCVNDNSITLVRRLAEECIKAYTRWQVVFLMTLPDPESKSICTIQWRWPYVTIAWGSIRFWKK